MPERTFTEDEVREIVRRASEQQAEDAERREAQEHGLTLDDLERLGAEVGLDPAYLRRAADEVGTGYRAVADAATQTDTHVVVERRIDHPFTMEAWEDTVPMLRQQFGTDMGTWYGNGGGGRVEQVGRAHEWVHTSQLGVETRVSVSERDGRTRLLLSQRVGQAAPKVEGFMWSAVIGLIVGVLAAIGVGDALDSFGGFAFTWIATMLVMTLVLTPLITRLDKRWRAKKQAKLKTLAADIERTFASAAPAEAVAAEPDRAEPAPEGRFDLDAVPDDAQESSSASTRNRSRS